MCFMPGLAPGILFGIDISTVIPGPRSGARIP
jgi:hypothetical protein